MSTKLQRYRINNCADIADDKGGYCDADDVTELEATNAELVNMLDFLLTNESINDTSIDCEVEQLLAKVRGDL